MINENTFKTTVIVGGRESSVCAVEEGKNIRFRFSAPRCWGLYRVRVTLERDTVKEDGKYADAINALYGKEGGSGTVSDANDAVKSVELSVSWVDINAGRDIYEASYRASACGLYFLRIEYDGADKSCKEDVQFTVYRKGWGVPQWLTDGIMYQIFPDRFAQSKSRYPQAKPGTYINDDWDNGIPKYPAKPGDPVDNNEFFGGSLYGIAEKLDYLSELGVSIIYLNPIFDAHSNHKYDTGDYTKVDSMLGGDKGLAELVKKCNERGIRIILDGVFNHTGSDSIYFNSEGSYKSVGAAQSETSQYRDWYNFRKYPNDYECWWGVKILPTLNKNSDTLREFITGENGVIRRWIRAGISGWRLDVADELPDNFLAEITAAAKKERNDAIIIGEVWEDASEKIAYDVRRKYFQGYELDSVMNYPYRTALINYVMRGNAENIAEVTELLYSHYPEFISRSQMNFLGTHDTERIIGMLSDENIATYPNRILAVHRLGKEDKAVAVKRLKLAATLLYTLPGVPCIYYGDEVGLEGWRDPFNRRPFPWGREDGDLLNHYRALGALRRGEADIRRGDFNVFIAENGVFGFSRGELTVVANCGTEAWELKELFPFSDLLSGACAEREADGRYSYFVLPQTAVVLKKKRKK